MKYKVWINLKSASRSDQKAEDLDEDLELKVLTGQTHADCLELNWRPTIDVQWLLWFAKKLTWDVKYLSNTTEIYLSWNVNISIYILKMFFASLTQ